MPEWTLSITPDGHKVQRLWTPAGFGAAWLDLDGRAWSAVATIDRLRDEVRTQAVSEVFDYQPADSIAAARSTVEAALAPAR